MTPTASLSCNNLLKQILSENLKLLHIFKSSVGVLLAYFLAKEIEVRNLQQFRRWVGQGEATGVGFGLGLDNVS